ncbi:PIN domain-containing protein [Belliella sp. DSM 111904]|uniref:PIN domain-containing protein n=1 Tax=Belliella filtrata TaxID=2923435 RepID=A0ABS9V0D9_9BACT|nr:PIN domain-containing protein [Belliella filtrata]MCH7409871.1 PIN domain-containing protein [Belliella filtrata]
MEKIFVDTNVILDLLQKREGFYKDAQEIFTMADLRKARIFISTLSIATANYLLSKHYNTTESRKILSKFKIIVTILPLDNKIIELALASDFKDFEDAIQYHTALEHELKIIITRNKKDFKKSKISVLTPKEFLSSLK